jgi:hypothetical protein
MHRRSGLQRCSEKSYDSDVKTSGTVRDPEFRNAARTLAHAGVTRGFYICSACSRPVSHQTHKTRPFSHRAHKKILSARFAVVASDPPDRWFQRRSWDRSRISARDLVAQRLLFDRTDTSSRSMTRGTSHDVKMVSKSIQGRT